MVYGLEPFRPKPPPRRATSTAGNDSLRSTIRFRARSRPTPERTSLSLLCKGHDSEVHLARALLSWHCFARRCEWLLASAGCAWMMMRVVG
jgi:hypothetical protein